MTPLPKHDGLTDNVTFLTTLTLSGDLRSRLTKQGQCGNQTVNKSPGKWIYLSDSRFFHTGVNLQVDVFVLGGSRRGLRKRDGLNRCLCLKL